MSMNPSSTGPKFKVGDRVIVNYGYGAREFTLKITLVSPNHGGPGSHRYYGVAASRGACGAYEDQIEGPER